MKKVSFHNVNARFWAIARPMPRAWTAGQHRSDGHFTFAAPVVVAVKPIPSFKREGLQ